MVHVGFCSAVHGLFCVLTVILVPGRSDLHIELPKVALAFAGGMGVGYGFKTYAGSARVRMRHIARGVKSASRHVGG